MGCQKGTERKCADIPIDAEKEEEKISGSMVVVQYGLPSKNASNFKSSSRIFITEILFSIHEKNPLE